MSGTAPESRVGSQFGPYKLGRLLGRGALGEVYEAVREAVEGANPAVVAVKLLAPELSADPGFAERLQQEAGTAERLRGPHLLPLRGHGEIDGQWFLEMPFVDGTDLATLLEQQGELSPPRAVGIIAQVAAALDAAHAAGVLHRDVKPENILLTPDDFVYLSDFGVADAVARLGTTQPQVTAKTWQYTAPERFTDAPVTHRADIYALTAVLYECLTGAPPYRAGSVAAMIASHLTQPPPRPSQLRPELPSGFDDVIGRGMAKDPEQRYASGGELAWAAHYALDGQLGRTPPAAADTRVAALPSGSSYPSVDHSIGRPARADDAADRVPTTYFPALEEARRAQRNKRLMIVGGVLAALIVLVAGTVGLLHRSGGPDGATETGTASAAPTVTAPTSTTSTAELQAKLVKLLPAGYPAGACKPVSAPAGAQARVSCGQNTDPDGPVSATYTLYPDVAALQAAFTQTVQAATVFECPGRIQSPGPWRHNASPDKTSGMVVCGTQKSNPMLGWSDEEKLLLSVVQSTAQGPTIEQLYTWWASHS